MFATRKNPDGSEICCWDDDNPNPPEGRTAMEISERTDWVKMRNEVLALISRLQKKPVELKWVHRQIPREILHAYRQGDVTFEAATAELEELAKPTNLIRMPDEEDREIRTSVTSEPTDIIRHGNKHGWKWIGSLPLGNNQHLLVFERSKRETPEPSKKWPDSCHSEDDPPATEPTVQQQFGEMPGDPPEMVYSYPPPAKQGSQVEQKPLPPVSEVIKGLNHADFSSPQVDAVIDVLSKLGIIFPIAMSGREVPEPSAEPTEPTVQRQFGEMPGMPNEMVHRYPQSPTTQTPISGSVGSTILEKVAEQLPDPSPRPDTSGGCETGM